MMKQESTTTTTMPVATVCGHCGAEERRLLHHVRHRGIFRRLCTTCVLRLHPQSFCPTCFHVYPPLSPNQNDVFVTCFKCYSSSHSHCVGPTPPPPNPYFCPLCANHGAPVFTLKKAGDGTSEINDNCRVIDKKGAQVLLAAAKIAAVSTSKAAVTARAEAERRAKEAAFARKRAREALEHVAFLVAKDKLKRKEEVLATATEVSRSGGNVGVQDKKNIKSENIINTNVVGVAENHRIGSEYKVLAALNAVELKETEVKVEGFRASKVELGQGNNGVAMDVEGDDKINVRPALGVVEMVVENHGPGNENERSGELCHLENHNSNSQGEKLNNGVASVQPDGDQLHHMRNSNVGEETNIVS